MSSAEQGLIAHSTPSTNNAAAATAAVVDHHDHHHHHHHDVNNSNDVTSHNNLHHPQQYLVDGEEEFQPPPPPRSPILSASQLYPMSTNLMKAPTNSDDGYQLDDEAIDLEEDRCIREQCRLETAIIMEALQHLPTEEERFSTLLDYFQQVVRASYIQLCENKRLETELDVSREHIHELETKNDSLMVELSKTEAMKSKLEGLCRELRRQNQEIAEEEKRKRNDITQQFNNTIRQMESKLDQQNQSRNDKKKEYETLRNKLKACDERYQVREKHFAAQLRIQVLQNQLADRKLKQQMELFEQEALRCAAYKEKLAGAIMTKNELRFQLAAYAEKFEQFQETLAKSNEIFATFKLDLEKARMTKTIKKLEKDRAVLQKKCEKTDITLIEMAEEKTNFKRDIESLKKQNARLEALCRVLQSERKKQSDEQASAAASAPATAPPAHANSTNSNGATGNSNINSSTVALPPAAIDSSPNVTQ